jgi:hypothetical protein
MNAQKQALAAAQNLQGISQNALHAMALQTNTADYESFYYKVR